MAPLGVANWGTGCNPGVDDHLYAALGRVPAALAFSPIRSHGARWRTTPTRDGISSRSDAWSSVHCFRLFVFCHNTCARVVCVQASTRNWTDRSISRLGVHSTGGGCCDVAGGEDFV